MGSWMIPVHKVYLQHFLSALPKQSVNPAFRILAEYSRVNGQSFCTKKFSSPPVTKRNTHKSGTFIVKERLAFPKSVFAAGTRKRTAELFEKKTRVPENDRPPGKEKAQHAQEVPDRPLTTSEWKSMKQASERPDRFESRMMTSLLFLNVNIDIAKSLLTFVAVETGTVSYEMLLRYLTMCVNGGHWAEMFDVYDIMNSNFRTLDTGAYSLLVKGFSRTERWQEALVLLDNISKIITPSSRNYSDAIAGAVLHGSTATAWMLYNQLVEKGVNPNQDAWRCLFDAGASDHSHDDKLICLLLNMRDNQIYPEERLVQAIRNWFECCPEHKWSGQFSSVDTSGACRNCGAKVESIELSPEDYASLKDSVMTNVIEGKDVFHKTTPEELEGFKAFVSKKPAFDVVIDGLNVANILGKGNQSETLLAVVSELKQQGLSVLVLGRKHMLHPTPSWKSHHMKQIQQKAHCFFTDNISEDDPFLLYAALNSGNHCKFVSRDLMRDHKACLPDGPTRRLFFKWQRGHQLVVDGYTPGKKVRFQKIHSYDTVAQTTETSWHIPYDEEGVERSTYEVPQKWLCLTRSN